MMVLVSVSTFIPLCDCYLYAYEMSKVFILSLIIHRVITVL